jgi:hypothetical protein
MKMIFAGASNASYMTCGKIYDCEWTYVGIIVKCDDGKYRKFETSDFITIEKHRHDKLSEILPED